MVYSRVLKISVALVLGGRMGHHSVERVPMRGKTARQATMLTGVTPDAVAPQHHPIRRIKPAVDQALAELSPTFDRVYARNGRASIPPEHPLKACLLMALFSVRRERRFCERLEDDLLFKWFMDLNIMDHSFDHSFDHSVFAKNRQRLLDADVAREFLLEIVEQARKQRSAIDRGTTRHEGYRLSQWARKRIEEVFGWVKTVAAKLRYFGVARNRFRRKWPPLATTWCDWPS